MLLPSAMTVAYTIENPSFTRASGTIPGVFMLAALPLGLVGGQVARLQGAIGARSGGRVIVALVIVAGVLVVWDRLELGRIFHRLPPELQL